MTTKKTLGIGTLAAAIAAALAFQVSAMPANMQIVGKANPPIGHYEFCQSYAAECAGSFDDRGPVGLTEPLPELRGEAARPMDFGA